MQAPLPSSQVEAALAGYRKLVIGRLLRELPASSHTYLYELVPSYPGRPGKVLRPALCLAACSAFGGDASRALNAAVAIELFTTPS